jgi:gas vesicle protein
MISRTRTAMKFFTYGLLIGLLFAPGSGKETRDRLLTWAGNNFKGILGA